jgi:hypothetical protein
MNRSSTRTVEYSLRADTILRVLSRLFPLFFTRQKLKVVAVGPSLLYYLYLLMVAKDKIDGAAAAAAAAAADVVL